MQSWDGFKAVRPRRAYLVRRGCEGSWIWADRVNDQRWCCDHCGQQWPAGQKQRVSPRPSRQRTRRERARKIDAPPGLGPKDKQVKHPVDDMLKKNWASLSDDVKKALQTVGIDYTPPPELQPLEELLKAHLEDLPKEVKVAVTNLVTPVKQEPKDVTSQLKVTVGELRQLSNKKAGLQRKVDYAKEQYRTLLDELKVVQELIDKEQQQLSAQSEAYAKILKEETKEAPGPVEVVDEDVNDHVLKALAQVGILYTETQKSDLERQLAESMLKRRKKTEAPPSG